MNGLYIKRVYGCSSNLIAEGISGVISYYFAQKQFDDIISPSRKNLFKGTDILVYLFTYIQSKFFLIIDKLQQSHKVYSAMSDETSMRPLSE